MKLFANSDAINFCSNPNNVEQDSLEELVARAQDLAQRWQDAIDDCASFDLAAVADAVAAAEDRENGFDIFYAYAAAEVDSEYLADLDGLVAAVNATSTEWKEERHQAAAVDLFDPADDEVKLGCSLSLPVAA